MKRGQALIEALVAVGIAVVALVALLRASNRSVGNSGVSRRQAVATAYATEAVSWLKSVKTARGYTFFKSELDGYCTGYPCTGMCMNTLPTLSEDVSWIPAQNCGSTTLGEEYDRYADFTLVSGGIQTTVSVEWSEDGRTGSSKQTYVFVNR